MSEDFINRESASINMTPVTKGRVRMAYTLNNFQPVQCTLIHEQPFFFMDTQDDFSDELIDDNFSDELLAEINALKIRIETQDVDYKEHKAAKDSLMQEFCTNFAPIENSNSTKEAFNLLKACRLTKEYMDQAYDSGIYFQESNQVNDAHYDKVANTIYMRSSLNTIDLTLAMVRELRRFWLIQQEAIVNPLTLTPDHAVVYNRIIKADSAATIVRAAWEMKLQGHHAVWQYIQNSSLQDLGHMLSREALQDFRSLNSGKALSAAFEGWFLSNRCHVTDKNLIQSMLTEYKEQTVHAEDDKAVLTKLICKIGEQPYGKNYLSAYAQIILSDTLFTEIRDRSNANFLWFIKFERSFKQAEQELQSSEATNKIARFQRGDGNQPEDNQNVYPSATQEGYVRFDHEYSLPFEETKIGKVASSITSNVIRVEFGQPSRQSGR